MVKFRIGILNDNGLTRSSRADASYLDDYRIFVEMDCVCVRTIFRFQGDITVINIQYRCACVSVINSYREGVVAVGVYLFHRSIYDITISISYGAAFSTFEGNAVFNVICPCDCYSAQNHDRDKDDY